MLRKIDGPVTLGRQASGVRRQAKEDPVSSAEETPAGGFPRKPSAYTVLKAVLDATGPRGIPAPDERLKSIVAAQITALLKGGYDPARVRHFAVELGLSWDNSRGHQRLLGLRQAVLQDAAEVEYKAHADRMEKAAEPVADPVLAKKLLDAAKHALVHRTSMQWTTKCSTVGCPRTALVGLTGCAAHAA